MNNKVFKWLIESKNNKELYDLATEDMKIKIKGFRKITYLNGKINIPRNILINEILSDVNKEKLEKVYSKKSLQVNLQYSKLTKRQLMNKVKKDESIVSIVEYLVGEGNYENKKIAEEIIDKIKSNHFIEQRKIIESEEVEYDKINLDIKLDNLKMELNKIKNENSQLVRENEELKNIKKELNKDKKLIAEKNINLNKKNEGLSKQLAKSKIDFISLKKKYDDVQVKIQNKNKIELENLVKIESVEKKYEKAIRELDEVRKFNNYKKNVKNISVFGEIHSKQIINSDVYELYPINIKNIEERDAIDKINKSEEIWLLNYETSIIEQIKIKKVLESKDIIEFDNYKSLKKYIDYRKGE